MSEVDLDLAEIQKVIDLGPFRLTRCKACRGVNLEKASPRCGWCGACLKTGALPAQPIEPRLVRSDRGQRGTRRTPSPSPKGRRRPPSPSARTSRGR